jgi:hypothetical protein
MTKLTTPVDESAGYENCLENKTEIYTENTLLGFMDLEEGELVETYEKEWQYHWKGMPEFVNNDNSPFKKLTVNFRTEEDYIEFGKLIGQENIMKSKSIWFPKYEIRPNIINRWIDEEDQEKYDIEETDNLIG